MTEVEADTTETASSARRGAGGLPDDAPHILVVDDDRRLRALLSRFLTDNGFRVTVAPSAAVAESTLSHLVFDALVLDVMMPGENGFDFAQRWRKTSSVPILMLTARTDGVDRVKGLEIGADDYLGKPFEPRELLLRLSNIIRRNTAAGEAQAPARTLPEVIRFGGFVFRFDRGELRHDDEIVRITEREREILTILGEAAGGQVPREELAGNAPVAAGGLASDRNVDVQINRLRRKIERDPANPVYLQTVRGVGYRLLIDG
ncbi:two-component system phosphate regulon response regulator OmpR [Pseudochelatococcus lubricantis]|uniref:Two-component system phosphate regulon response regulator OmpR n=1 Tax=Pseudochelatococcus lubricantis TaxID=1538102 RepID=A0ABX0V3F8_9HYPH|nr:response regulator transcription factor [Pseudochelatococcus lubricantis]NIJ58629.1 two-component system phosphate regulon response regulator OmpR [Pseudochelatococcus lubricantis]